MKFYVAAPWEMKPEVKEIISEIRERGHEVEGDWTEHEDWRESNKPNSRLAQEQLDKDIRSAAECDIFILISSEKSRGSHLELGAALNARMNDGDRPEIYVVGEKNESHLFYHYPEIERKESVNRVLKSVI